MEEKNPERIERSDNQECLLRDICERTKICRSRTRISLLTSCLVHGFTDFLVRFVQKHGNDDAQYHVNVTEVC